MKEESYDTVSGSDYFSYWFVSNGKKLIIKVVQFQPSEMNLYNLSLGDYDPISAKIDYKAESKNGDVEKIFATVAKIIIDFTNQYPNYSVLIQGVKDYKTKSYAIVINKFLEELEVDFEITGVERRPFNNGTEEVPYQKGRKYDAFIIRKRENKLTLYKD